MAIWVCRAGKKSVYVKEFLNSNKIYCTWDGYAYDLNKYESKEDLKQKIRSDVADSTTTAVNTWAAQLLILRDKMRIGDIVLTPNENSQSYNIGIIESDYFYDKDAKEHFYHCRRVKWIQQTILREAFPQHIIYSLGAYRTIFRLKYENEFFEVINKANIQL